MEPPRGLLGCRYVTAQCQHDRVWEIVENAGVCMLTTRFAGGLRARPMQPRADRAAGLIFFVTDVRAAKDDEIDARHDVGLVFVDHAAKAYLSMTAQAQIRNDPGKAAEIWRQTDDLWWDGPHDPNVRVLQVEPQTAELWDGPKSAAVAMFEMARARITGDKPNLGENRKVTVSL